MAIGLVAGTAGIIALAVVAVCAVPAFGFFVWLFLGPDVDDAKAAAGQYLERVEARDDAGAYQLLCAQARRDLTQEAFTAAVDAGPRPAGHAFGRGVFLDEPGHEASIDVQLTDRAGATRRISLTLEDEGSWLVCGDPLI